MILFDAEQKLGIKRCLRSLESVHRVVPFLISPAAASVGEPLISRAIASTDEKFWASTGRRYGAGGPVPRPPLLRRNTNLRSHQAHHPLGAPATR